LLATPPTARFGDGLLVLKLYEACIYQRGNHLSRENIKKCKKIKISERMPVILGL
jgi:hypothetical protein